MSLFWFFVSNNPLFLEHLGSLSDLSFLPRLTARHRHLLPSQSPSFCFLYRQLDLAIPSSSFPLPSPQYMVSSHLSYPAHHVSASLSSRCLILVCLLHKSYSQSFSILPFNIVLPINPSFTGWDCRYLFLLPLCTFSLETFNPNGFLPPLQSCSY